MDLGTLVGTLVGVVLGAALTYEIQQRLRREDTALKARLVLTETLRHPWGDTERQTIKTHLHRLRAYLEDAGVKEDLVNKLEGKAWECWKDSRKNAAEHFDPDVGHVVSMTLIDEYEAIEAEVHESLRKR